MVLTSPPSGATSPQSRSLPMPTPEQPSPPPLPLQRKKVASREEKAQSRDEGAPSGASLDAKYRAGNVTSEDLVLALLLGG
jgi:hypothetical protein